MRIALTGGAGFIGSHVAERLLREEHAVLIADDFSRGLRENLTAIGYKGGFFGDLSDRDTAAKWTARVRDWKADVLVHLASPMSHNPLDHLLGMELAAGYLRTCQELQIPTVFMSSSSAHNAVEPRGLYNEALKPEGLYGMTKAFIEWGLHDLHKAGAIPSYIALRPSNAYGPREVFSGHPHIHVIPSLIRKIMLKQTPIEVWGDGTQTRPFTYVLDIVDAIWRAVTLVTVRKMHDLALVHGVPVSIGEALGLIMEAMGSKEEVVFIKRANVGVESRQLPRPDGDLLGGWKANWRIREGIRATVEWVKQHPESLHRGEVDTRPLGTTVA